MKASDDRRALRNIEGAADIVDDGRRGRSRERQHALGMLGHPQMLLRLGYPAGDAVASGRRPVAEVLQLG